MASMAALSLRQRAAENFHAAAEDRLAIERYVERLVKQVGTVRGPRSWLGFCVVVLSA